MVDVVGMPILWASFIIFTHSALETLLGHILALTEFRSIPVDALVILLSSAFLKGI